MTRMTKSQIENLEYSIAVKIYEATGQKTSNKHMQEIMEIIARRYNKKVTR